MRDRLRFDNKRMALPAAKRGRGTAFRARLAAQAKFWRERAQRAPQRGAAYAAKIEREAVI